MERFVGVEEARGFLGQLVDDVAAGGDVVALTKCGRPLVVLVSREDYVRLKLAQADQARSELREALGEARRKVGAAGLDPGVIDEAIAAARSL